jgi:hypothetical protein
MLYIDDTHRLAISGTTNGYKILSAFDKVNVRHRELEEYGVYRVMSCCSLELYRKIRTQEDLVRKRLNIALSTEKGTKAVDEFCASADSLCRGYDLVMIEAKKNGLTKIDIDFFCLNTSDGREIYVVPNEDLKALLKHELESDNLCIYSMQELSLLISDDKIAYELKKNFNAQLTGVKSVETNTH